MTDKTRPRPVLVPDEHATVWPEQEALITWLDKHKIKVDFEQRKELAEAMTAIRLKAEDVARAEGLKGAPSPQEPEQGALEIETTRRVPDNGAAILCLPGRHDNMRMVPLFPVGGIHQDTEPEDYPNHVKAVLFMAQALTENQAEKRAAKPEEKTDAETH
jgi:hypothetical protein